MKILFIIPARGGSKELPGKNIRLLSGRPLIGYSLNYARLFSDDKDICISTDSENIAKVVSELQYNVAFYRPVSLSNDNAGMYGVIMHGLEFYEGRNGQYDAVLLLQPTSPFRRKFFFEDILKVYNADVDMVVGVKESKANPYFNLFEENREGFLELSKNEKGIVRRQDAPPTFQYNGSIYFINAKSLRRYSAFSEFDRVVKYIMPDNYSIDIDNEMDWNIAEYMVKNNLVIGDGKY